MKKTATLFSVVLLLGLTFVLQSHKSESNTTELKKITAVNPPNIEIPSDVQTIIDNKCYGCHNNESKSSKGKMKLNFDKMTDGTYSTGKLVGKLGKIKKTLHKEKMPPSKFLAKYPDKKLTADEAALLTKWATDQANILSK